MFESYKARRQAHKHKNEQDKIRQAGDAMALAVIEQIEEGQTSPYEVKTKKTLSTYPDEMFLARATKRAVEYMAAHLPHRELPLYDEHSTLLENHQSKSKELIVWFSSPSESYRS